MDFFGIGLFEIVLVLIFGLLVLGPERLQHMGRTVGRLTAQWLAWQQASPELQAVQRIRSEFESEINSLRDEIVRARQQIDVSQEVQRLRDEGRTIGQFPATVKQQIKSQPPADAAADVSSPASVDEPAVATEPDTPPADGAPAAATDADSPTPARDRAADATGTADAPASLPADTPAPPTGAADLPPTNGIHAAPSVAAGEPDAAPPEAPADAPTAGDVAELRRQVEMLTSELQSLRRLLATRGIVDTSYAPPKEPVER